MENFQQILATFYTHFKHYSGAIAVLIVFKQNLDNITVYFWPFYGNFMAVFQQKSDHIPDTFENGKVSDHF